MNRASYNIGKRITNTHIAHRIGFKDLNKSNVFFPDKEISELEFNSLVAQVKNSNKVFKSRSVKFSADFVLEIYQKKFNRDIGKQYDVMSKGLGTTFKKTDKDL